jgi:hypothetical protein
MTLEAWKEYRATMQAITTTQLRTIICDAARAAAPLFSKAPPPPPPNSATLRIIITRADSGSALPRFPVWLRWVDPQQVDSANPRTVQQMMQEGVRKTRLQGVQSITDETGGVTFCGVPSEAQLELVMLRGDDDPTYPEGARAVRIGGFVLKRGELALRSVSVTPPK